MSNIRLARSLRRRMTLAERYVWGWLRDYGCLGLKFRRQHPLYGYIVDFYCAELNLIVEIDGGVHDAGFRRVADAERTRRLSSLGLNIFRIPNDVVIKERFAAWDTITSAVVRVVAEKTGRSETDTLRELHEQLSPLSPPRGERVG